MKQYRIRGLVALALVLLCACAASAQVPDTPAGRLFTGWLDAINSGDRATLQQFFDRSMPPGRSIEPGLALRAQTDGFDVKRMVESSDTRIVVLVQERAPTKQFARITLTVAAESPDRIGSIAVQATEPPADLAPPRLTAAAIEAAKASAPFRQFDAWLDVFNAGDRARLSQFLQHNYPSMTADAQLNFRARTGGFEFRALEQATATTVTGLVQERDSDQFARFVLTVEAAEPHQITRFAINAIPRPAEFPVQRLGESDLITTLRAKLEKDAAADRFAGTVIIGRIENGAAKVLFSGAYGLADREQKIPNSLDTRFRIGSMNKMFTAVSILQLVQAGKIKLDDPVGKYLTDYPNKDVADKVTIHHLLTHTGGTGDIFGPQYSARRLELRTLADYVALYGNRAPEFEPGSRWAYSNYGMLLLGVVIERVTGQSYYDYVAENIYRPAGMTGSGSEPESEGVRDRSIGYMRAQGAAGWTPNTNTLPYRGTSAGGGYSTVGDLMKFATALLAHRLLNEQYTTLLITGKADTGGGARYAYGFQDARTDGAGSVGHGGGAPGMNGDLKIYPQSGHVVVVLSNLDPPAASQVSAFIDLRLPR